MNNFILMNISIIFFIIVSSCISLNATDKIITKDDALKIAENNFVKMFGKKVLSKKPFDVFLKDDVWYVKGTLPSQPGVIMKGGVPYIEIRKKDGKILNIYHTK